MLQQSAAKYVLVGIPEDIGIKANHGIGGADTTWYPFLHSFLNTQSNDFFTGEDVLLLGHFDFGDVKYLVENNAYNNDEMIDAYRHAVNIIDEEVEMMMKTIAFCKKIPVIIGGGGRELAQAGECLGNNQTHAGFSLGQPAKLVAEVGLRNVPLLS